MSCIVEASLGKIPTTRVRLRISRFRPLMVPPVLHLCRKQSTIDRDHPILAALLNDLAVNADGGWHDGTKGNGRAGFGDLGAIEDPP